MQLFIYTYHPSTSFTIDIYITYIIYHVSISINFSVYLFIHLFIVMHFIHPFIYPTFHLSYHSAYLDLFISILPIIHLYISGTMAFPGEPETNYNAKRPIWEVLKLPFGPHVEGAKEQGLLASLSLKKRYIGVCVYGTIFLISYTYN